MTFGFTDYRKYQMACASTFCFLREQVSKKDGVVIILLQEGKKTVTHTQGCKILVAGGHNLFMSLLLVINPVL